MLDWRKVFFVDDDILISADRLGQVGVALDRSTIAYLHIEHFRDYSTVGRALREYLFRPDSDFFGVSGGAIGVSIAGARTLFPDVFNEDLFFSGDALHRLSLEFSGKCSTVPVPGRTFCRGHLRRSSAMSLRTPSSSRV